MILQREIGRERERAYWNVYISLLWLKMDKGRKMEELDIFRAHKYRKLERKLCLQNNYPTFRVSIQLGNGKGNETFASHGSRPVNFLFFQDWCKDESVPTFGLRQFLVRRWSSSWRSSQGRKAPTTLRFVFPLSPFTLPPSSLQQETWPHFKKQFPRALYSVTYYIFCLWRITFLNSAWIRFWRVNLPAGGSMGSSSHLILRPGKRLERKL